MQGDNCYMALDRMLDLCRNCHHFGGDFTLFSYDQPARNFREL